MSHTPLLPLVLLSAASSCWATAVGVWQTRGIRHDYNYLLMAQFALSQQKNIRFYNSVLELKNVQTMEYLGKHYSIEFTIAPTYCNARIKYNSDVCKPIINRPIGLCNAVVHDKPWENWRNVTYFACIPPEDKAKVFEGLLENLSPA
ncbi:cystatin-2-like isoform X2 [Amblyomma americanum]